MHAGYFGVVYDTAVEVGVFLCLVGSRTSVVAEIPAGSAMACGYSLNLVASFDWSLP